MREHFDKLVDLRNLKLKYQTHYAYAVDHYDI